MDISTNNEAVDFSRSSVSPENSVSLVSSNTSEEKGLSAISAVRKRIFALETAKRKSTFKKIQEAILAIQTSTNKKGASLFAIANWILCNYEILDPSKLKRSLKMVIIKALEKRTLQRAPSSKNVVGLGGNFSLPQKQNKLDKKVRKEKPKRSAFKSDREQMD